MILSKVKNVTLTLHLIFL